jgi:hypothetical protein
VVRLADASEVNVVSPAVPAKKVTETAGPVLTVSSDKVSVSFNTKTGLMESVTRLDTVAADGSALTSHLSQDFAYYKSFGSPGMFRINHFL